MASRILALMLMLVGAVHSGLAQDATASPPAPTLVLISTPHTGVFRVELRNSGVHDLVLNLGFALANGAKQYPNAVEFMLKTPDGRLLHLKAVEPAIIAGRVDPLIVPLPSGATFSLLIDLKKYGALDEKVWHLDFSPGRYTLQAEYEGKRVPASQANLDVKGIALMTYWVGKVASTPVAFNVVSGEETIPDR